MTCAVTNSLYAVNSVTGDTVPIAVTGSEGASFADGTLIGEPSFGVGVGVQDPSPGGAIMLNGGYAFTFTNDGLDF